MLILLLALKFFVGDSILTLPSSKSAESSVILTLTQNNGILPEALIVPAPHKLSFGLYAIGYQTYQCDVGNVGKEGNWTFGKKYLKFLKKFIDFIQMMNNFLIYLKVGPRAYLFDKYSKNSTLLEKNIIGEHFFQPLPGVNGGRATWQGNDKSEVVTNITKQVNIGSETIDWFISRATANKPGGIFTNVTYVLRVDTENVQLPPNYLCDPSIPQEPSVPQRPSVPQGARINQTFVAKYWFYTGPQVYNTSVKNTISNDQGFSTSDSEHPLPTGPPKTNSGISSKIVGELC
ncbi:hypothetical protein G9A89_002577 [Geosiphon pyriformis]|nr:hypothetical protein G9A89_002577 [Geosiphon pyriformis]